LTTKTETKTNS